MKRWVLVIVGLGSLVCAVPGGTAEAQEVRSTSRGPQIWAVVVGVGDHDDPTIPDSQSAGPDAGKVVSWLLRSGGWSRDHLLHLTDQGSRQPGTVENPKNIIMPTRENLDWAFQKWLPSRFHPGDLVVFYFAGRAGSALPLTGEARPEYYLLPIDAQRAKLATTGWSLERALDRLMLDTQGRGQVVCLLGTAIGVHAPGIKPPDPEKATTLGGRNWLGRLARWPGVTAWLARDLPAESAARDEPSARFTRTLLKELSSSRKYNLAACLEAMQRDPVLRQDAFQTMGAVNPRLTLWPDVFGVPPAVPRPEMTLQVGHADKVTGIVVSADGQRAVSASMDSTVRVWSLKEKTLVRVLTGHEVGATALGLSGDGRWLVSGGGRPANAILVHDLDRDYRQVIQDQPHDRAVVQVVMLPDGRHFVSVDLDARSFLWDLKATPPEFRPWLDKPADKSGKAGAKVNCREVACGGDADHGVVAALGDDRSVHVLDASGTNEVVLREWADQPTTLAVDPRGLWLALGFKDGRIVVRDLATGRATEARVGVDNPIARLVFSARGLLAVGHGRGLSVFPVTDGRIAQDPGGKTLTDQVPGEIAFSPDGTHLAASTPRDVNGLRVWHFEDDEPKPLAGDEQAGASALAFTGDGRLLLAGGFRGGIEARPLEGLRINPVWSMPANRAKVMQLAASPSRRFLLMINDLGLAQVWDLKERSCRRLPGSWTSGAFASRDDRLVLTETPGQDRPGRVVSVELVGGKVTADPLFFKRAAAGIDGDVAFVSVVLSPDGSRVAAAANPTQDPLVYVWETKTGLLTYRIGQAGLKDPVRSLSFSSDARYLLTSGDSPEARLWDLAAGRPEPAAPIVTFRDPVARHISACLIRPGDFHQVVTGHRNGLVRLWTWREGQATPVGPPIDLVEGLFAGEVKALSFASDGKDHYLAAAGDGTSLWLARMAEPRPVRVNDLGVRPHHFEQVNALTAWPVAPEGTGPSTPTLISGSDDTMVKLWDIKDRALSLRATFSASGGQHDADAPAGPDAAAVELDWVVFTPDGHFDASAKGRDLIRFRLNDQARAMEQFDESKLNTFDLGASLLTGKPFEGVATLAEPPPIKIESPAPVAPNRPDTQVTITLGSVDLKDVRLYHNNVPIGSGLEARRYDDEKPSGPGRISVPVRLVKGSNHFYAMATATGRAGSWDSRSDEVEIAYDGPSDPGKLHIIALGVGDYKTRKLKFADRDAERISEVLHERGLDVGGKTPGMRIVRTNGDVTTEGVSRAFGELAREVKGRPQDTVVVFLAGHTGVFESLQFCLLLPSYRFPAGAPLVASARDAVVTRDAVGAEVPPRAGDVMPYSVIEANLMRLDALNRLVIVDACQAEAIFDDAQVREIRKWMEVNSRKARNSYLMAARRGEPALEVEGLRHGLFTYTLLRGMGGGINRADEPSMISDLALRDNADFNGDGIITTGELDDYAKRTLPMLAQLFPTLMTRSRDEEARQRPNLPAIREAELAQDLRMQSVSVSFPLVPLPAAR